MTRFRVIESAPVSWEHQRRCVVGPTGQRRTRPVRNQPEQRIDGKLIRGRPVIVMEFRHDGRLLEVGDVVESDRDLAKAFPDRFEAVTEDEREGLNNG